MKLKIKFDEIKDAIEQASYENHYLIDKKNHLTVFISEYEDEHEKKLEEVENGNFIGIEPRTPNNEFDVMQSFVYKIRDFNLAKEFHDALSRIKPFRNFKGLLSGHPELKEEWFEYRDHEIANVNMNWLCEKDIELEDKSFMPKVEIKELKADEVNLPEGFEGFGPVACMRCNNKAGFKTRYFELSHSAENMLIDQEIKKIMKNNYGIEDYGCIGGGDKEILTCSECPKCKSKDIFEDF